MELDTTRFTWKKSTAVLLFGRPWRARDEDQIALGPRGKDQYLFICTSRCCLLGDGHSGRLIRYVRSISFFDGCWGKSAHPLLCYILWFGMHKYLLVVAQLSLVCPSQLLGALQVATI